MTWKIHRRFWARSAGVSVDAVRLASPEAVASIDATADLARQLDAVETELLAAGTARRVRRRVRAGGDLSMDDQVGLDPALVARRRELRDALAAARAADVQAIDVARGRERDALWKLLEEQRMREATALTSRSLAGGFAHALEHGIATSMGPSRLVEHRALLFAQRLTAKPAMLSEIGPCFWGELDADGTTRARIGNGLVRERRTWFEHWSIHALAKRIQADPEIRPFCIVRLNPSCLLEGKTLYYPVNHRLRLEPLEAELLQWCSQGQTLAALDAAIAARETDRDQLATLLANHLKSGVATCDIDIPTVDVHPEQRLRAFLASLPDACASKPRWLGELTALDDLRRDLERAPLAARRDRTQALDARFEATTGVAPTRNPGVVHGARFITYEDAARDVDVTLGEAVAHDLAALEPMFDLASWVVHVAAARFERKLLPIHARLARNLNAVDFVTFVRETQWINEAPDVGNSVLADLQDVWQEVLGDRLTATEPLELSPDDFRQVTASLGRGGAGPWLPAADVHSACVHVASTSTDAIAAGDYQLVLDKLYKGVPMLVHPAALPFCPDREDVTASFRSWTRTPIVQLVDTPGSYHRSNLNLPDVPELKEVALPGAPSRLPPERVIRCSELEVVAEDDGLVVASHDGTVRAPYFMIRWPFLQRKLLDIPLHPVVGGAHSPRITMGRWLLAREQWRLDGEELVRRWGRETPLVAITRWRRELGIPDHVFVRTAAQPKSIALDLRSVLHAELLRRVVARAAHRNDEVRITAMMPAPDRCWLTDAAGARYVCELRFTALASQ